MRSNIPLIFFGQPHDPNGFARSTQHPPCGIDAIEVSTGTPVSNEIKPALEKAGFTVWLKERTEICETMSDYSYFRLQFIVFALVAASFTNIYITQPVLPVLQSEFAADMVLVSFSVSAVILGTAISNLPFGFLADRLPIHPIIFTGGLSVAVGGLVCAVTKDLWILIGARFLQGIFIPSLTTCLAAYLAKTLPVTRLNVVMGSYVSATVLGGLCGRLLGGWLHPPLHWRYAFISASTLTLIAAITAMRGLPRTSGRTTQQHKSIGFWGLIKHWELLLLIIPLFTGIGERKNSNRRKPGDTGHA